MPDWHAIFAELARQGVNVPDDIAARPVSGGDINAAWRIETPSEPLFLKTASAADFDMFDAEAAP